MLVDDEETMGYNPPSHRPLRSIFLVAQSFMKNTTGEIQRKHHYQEQVYEQKIDF